MEEKKQQENDEIVREPETDKESCQQDDKARSEEKVETTENDESLEESTDSEDGDNKRNLREAIGKEVTWAAVAALGGTIIVIWNIIRYTFIWVSSFLLYHETNVPIYLLEQRKNVGFSNFYLAYFTGIIVVMIISYFQYSLLSKEMGERIHKLLEKVTIPILIIPLLVVVIRIILTTIIANTGLVNRIDYYCVRIELVFVGYVVPFYCMLNALFVGPVLHEVRVLDSEVNVFLTFYEKHLKDKEPDKEITNLYDELKESFKESKEINKSWKKSVVWMICIILFCFFYMCSINSYQLVDQDNRIIVADLGEYYIVQETQYDTNKQILMVDNSSYYVIDSADEKVSILRSRYKPKK